VKTDAEQKFLVVGLGFRTGFAVCSYLASKGAGVAVSDNKSAAELSALIEKLDPAVKVFAGNQNPSLLDEGYDLIVLSPGVPKSIPLIREAAARGIPVISEIEFAFRRMKGTAVGITGTDGKSTTTSLLHHMLVQLGLDAKIGGNIGIPLISFADETTASTVSVIELSSYQLETIDSFRPRAAAMLNLSPDHLDRYNGMDDYLAAKMRIAMNQTSEDFFIYNSDDAAVSRAARGVRAGKLGFSLTDTGADIYYKGGSVFMKGQDRPVLDTSRMMIFGLHNVQNAMAALLLARSCFSITGSPPEPEAVAEALCSFPGLEHRMERVGVYEGRLFINDSKATTVAAVETALKSLNVPVVLVLGGREKGDDYARLIPALKERVRALVLVGETSDKFEKIFMELHPRRAETFDDAAALSMKLSEPGDTVLLSPACASFDMFESYEHRGRVFKESFTKLEKGELSWN
jgi:UDP-N-acetylmuramoylalanine--D-glutamate ligase